MIPGKEPNARVKRRRGKAIVAALVGVIAGGFALFFALVNDGWVPIYIPTLPWNPQPSIAAFEARIAGVMVVAFLLGVLVATILWRVISSDQRRRAADDRARIKGLETELDKVSKLVASSRDKG